MVRVRHISPSMPYRGEGRYQKAAKGQLRPNAIARAEIPDVKPGVKLTIMEAMINETLSTAV